MSRSAWISLSGQSKEVQLRCRGAVEGFVVPGYVRSTGRCDLWPRSAGGDSKGDHVCGARSCEGPGEVFRLVAYFAVGWLPRGSGPVPVVPDAPGLSFTPVGAPWTINKHWHQLRGSRRLSFSP